MFVLSYQICRGGKIIFHMLDALSRRGRYSYEYNIQAVVGVVCAGEDMQESGTDVHVAICMDAMERGDRAAEVTGSGLNVTIYHHALTPNT